MVVAEICFNFQNHGECKWGKTCRYLHVSASKSLCLDWKKGNCPRGDSCRFAHRYGADIIEPKLTKREIKREANNTINIAQIRNSQSFIKNNVLIPTNARFATGTNPYNI